MVVVLVYRGS